jgi:DNA modification methylase
MLATVPTASIQTCVTSPPYWGLRDYDVDGQIGLESSPAEYVDKMVQVFREVRRVLKQDGTLWLNLGDSYASIGRSARDESPGVGAKQEMKAVERKLHWKAGGGNNFSWSIPSFGTFIKPKDLVGIPWRVAFALQADGWYLRSDIIWHKPNPMPESVTDRPTKAHEYLFLLSKSERYYYDHEAIKEQALRAGDQNNATPQHNEYAISRCITVGETRNKRSVWTIATQPYPEAHFATFPPKLIEPCILAGSRPGDTVLDPFAGSGTTLSVAKELNRQFLGIELNPVYVQLIEDRLRQEVLPL